MPNVLTTDINPFYLSLLGCVAAAAADRGYALIVSFQDGETGFFANYVGGHQADGLIVIGSGQNTEGWQFFSDYAKHKTPMICWGAGNRNLVSIKSDNIQGTRFAIDHLLSRGCRNIAFIGPADSEQPQFRERLAAYKSILLEKGFQPICPLVPENAGREEQGYSAVSALVKRGIIFDGIFAANDFIALGAMRALAEHGKQVGRDIRVIGFDGIATGAYAQPPLTTIEQDYNVVGEMLVDALLAVMAGEPPNTTPVPVRLLERETC